MLRVAIVDDEPLARTRLRRMFASTESEVVAEGINGDDAVEIARQGLVDVLVIDINMPRLNGLDAVKLIEETVDIPPAIIFCTAHDQYAVQAFKTEAVAYLLKPFSNADLAQALEKAMKYSASQKMVTESIDLTLHQGVEPRRVSSIDVAYLYSADKSVYAVLNSGEELLANATLKELEKLLHGQYVRCHRAFLVRIDGLKTLIRDGSAANLSLKDSTQLIPVSRRHLTEVKQCF